MNKMKILLKVAPLLTESLYKEDIIIAITDTTNVLYYSQALTLDANIPYKQSILDTSLFGEIKRKRTAIETLSHLKCGKRVRALGFPIFNHTNTLVGMIVFWTQKDTNIHSILKSLLRIDPILNEHFGQFWYGITKKHSLLNHICKLCGMYGKGSGCVSCFVEIQRQQEIMLGMVKKPQTSTPPLPTLENHVFEFQLQNTIEHVHLDTI